MQKFIYLFILRESLQFNVILVCESMFWHSCTLTSNNLFLKMKFVSYVDFINTNINFHRRMSRMGIFITPHLKHFMISEFLSVMIIKVAVVWNVISTLNDNKSLL